MNSMNTMFWVLALLLQIDMYPESWTHIYMN